MTRGKWIVWQLAPTSDPEERAIVTSEDGDTEVCGIVPDEEDADFIAAGPDMIDCIRGLVSDEPARRNAARRDALDLTTRFREHGRDA